MAIIAPNDLPSIIKINSGPMKKYVLSKLGYPNVTVEISEDQFEIIWKVVGDFISGYFPREQKLAVFYTQPLQATYPLPNDAYWIQSCHWNAVSSFLNDIFGAESFLFNIGNISGIQNILTDYHLLQSYRKFSQKVLATEGHWEVLNEGGSAGVIGDQINAANQLIRLYPTPKGVFPVVVLYIPVVTHFRSPQARKLAYDYMEAEAKIAVGSARRKVTNMPSPEGGSLGWDGGELVGEGIKAKEEIIKMAIELGEPMLPAMWSIIPLLISVLHLTSHFA
jgi:hypothetical protein